MSPDAPDRPVSFARLQQQLILTEVELMKLEDLRDELLGRVNAADQLRREMQQLADQACAERDHLRRQAAELETSARHARERLATEQASVTRLEAQVTALAAELAQQQALANGLKARIATVESSASWRWTAPLRALGRLFGRRA